MKIKICGIKTLDDALMAVEAGADMIGFNFYPSSPRYITPGDCMRLVVRLETALREDIARLTLVGVFVNTEKDNIYAIFRDCHLDMIQLHGDEQPDVLEWLGERSYQALRPTSIEQFEDAVKRFPPRTMAPAWLIDTFRPGEYGGTGKTMDWDLARQIALQAPVLLAGGLRAENVAEAIRRVTPWGVDVASGVESVPGVKDPQKVKDFIHAIRSLSKEQIS